MIRHQTVVLGACLLAAAVTAGCSDDDPTSVPSFSGTFNLTSIDGQGLPYLSYVVPLTFDTLFISGGEVRVLSNGRVSVVRRTRWHTSANGPQPEAGDTMVVPYRERPGMLLLDYPQFGAAAAHTDTAVLAGDALTVRTLFDFGGDEFLYVMRYSR